MIYSKPLAVLLFFGITGLVACNSSQSGVQETTSNDTIAELKADSLREQEISAAAANFATYCSGCHGDNATTFADRKWKFGESREALFASIKEGHPDAGMPAFANTFSEQEIQQLVSYIREGMEQVAQYSFEEKESLPRIIQTEQLRLQLDTVASGFGNVPWGMAFLPDGAMLITEISGKLYHRSADGDLQQVSGTPPVMAQGQGGLLDVALHPEFEQNKLVYLSYSAQKQQGGQTLSTTAIMRARLEGSGLRQQQVIFEAQPWSTTRHHYGSRLVFGPDGYLYFSVGDRGNHDENPQDLSRDPGKIHRIKDDGSAPADNPFAGQHNARPSIYSYGHRNPQGLSFNPQTGELWAHEHGPRGGDEINKIEKGANYGWPLISYGINYDGTILTRQTAAESMQQPLLQWTPSIAPSGMAFVSGNRYKGWEGNILSGSLRFQYLNRSSREGTKFTDEEKLLKKIGRLRDVKMGPDGYLYIAVENPARIYRLVPVNQ